MRTFGKPAKLSGTQEDYLRALYLLEESGQSVTVNAVADRLGLSKSTVSERLKDLTAKKLVLTSPYSAIVLTKEGFLAGKKLTYKHRLLEVFLYQTLGLPQEQVHAEAEALEHALSDNLTPYLAKFLDYPISDPHGSPLPKITLKRIKKLK